MLLETYENPVENTTPAQSAGYHQKHQVSIKQYTLQDSFNDAIQHQLKSTNEFSFFGIQVY